MIFEEYNIINLDFYQNYIIITEKFLIRIGLFETQHLLTRLFRLLFTH